MKTGSVWAILLIVILALQSGGMLFLLKIQQEFQRFEMSRLESFDFDLLTLSHDEFEACRTGRRELIYQNRLYDIYFMTKSENNITVLAVNDSGEERIIEQMRDVAASGYDHSHNHRTFKLILFNFLQPEITGLIQQTFNVELQYPISTADLQLALLDIPSPPPKTFFNQITAA